jgi:hypothetical protein
MLAVSAPLSQVSLGQVEKVLMGEEVLVQTFR